MNDSVAGESALDRPQSPTPDPTTSVKGYRRAMWLQANELLIDLAYNNRSHFNVGQRTRARVKWLGVPRAVLPVFASAGTAFLALFGVGKDIVVAFGFAAAMVVALDHYFDPLRHANAHTDKGDRLLTLYKDVRYFRNVRLRSGASDDMLERELAALRQRDDQLRKTEPRQVPEWAFNKARAQINDNQADYAHDPLWVDPPEDLG